MCLQIKWKVAKHPSSKEKQRKKEDRIDHAESEADRLLITYSIGLFRTQLFFIKTKARTFQPRSDRTEKCTSRKETKVKEQTRIQPKLGDHNKAKR